MSLCSHSSWSVFSYCGVFSLSVIVKVSRQDTFGGHMLQGRSTPQLFSLSTKGSHCKDLGLAIEEPSPKIQSLQKITFPKYGVSCPKIQSALIFSNCQKRLSEDVSLKVNVALHPHCVSSARFFFAENQLLGGSALKSRWLHMSQRGGENKWKQHFGPRGHYS